MTLCNLMISGFDDVIWGRRGADEQTENVIAVDPRRGQRRPAGRSSTTSTRTALIEGYKEETGRAGAGYTGVRLRAVEESCRRATRIGTHTRDEQLKRARTFPEGDRAGGREGQRAAGAASQRSAGAAEPRLAADHGHLRALEEVSGSGQQPVQRHHVRLRRHARDGRGPGRGLPLLRQAGPHQPRALPQRASCARRYVDYTEVFLDEGQVDMFGVMQRAGEAEVPRGALPRASAGHRFGPRAARFPTQYPGRRRIRGRDYNVGYARAMLQAALTG